MNIEELEAYLRANPLDLEVRTTLAVTYQQLQNYSGALRDVTRDAEEIQEIQYANYFLPRLYRLYPFI